MELAHLIGKTGKPFTFKVEQRHIRQFAQAIGDTNPLYTDEEYVINTPHKGLIAPNSSLSIAARFVLERCCTAR